MLIEYDLCSLALFHLQSSHILGNKYLKSLHVISITGVYIFQAYYDK